MKIESKLILYDHPRYNVFCPTNAKYRYKSLKNITKPLLRKVKNLKSNDIIRKRMKDALIGHFSYQRQINKYLLDLLRSQRHLKHLSFTYNSIETDPPKGKNSYSLLRKIFIESKSVTSVEADLVLFKADESACFILESLSLLRYLHHLELKICTGRNTSIDVLLAYLLSQHSKQRWPKLKSQRITLDLTFSEANFFKRISDALLTLQQITKYVHTELKFTFYFDQRIEVKILKILETSLSNLANVKNLALKSDSSVDLTTIFEYTGRNSLKCLTLAVKGLTLATLVKPVLERASDLSFLDVCLVDSSLLPGVHSFIDQLKHFTQLKILRLSLWWVEEWNDQSVISLATSLSTLINLEELHLECREHQRKSEIKTAGIQVLFESLQHLIHLTYLSLKFGGCHHYIDDKSIEVLFNSLGHLTDLRYLSLEFKYNAVGDCGLRSLEVVLPKLVNLHTLQLDFEGCEWLCVKRLGNLARSISCLTFLSHLTLQFMCFTIDSATNEAFACMIKSLKSLSYLKLILCQPEGKEATGGNLLSNICRRMRKEVDCYYRVYNSMRSDDFSFYHGLYINKNSFF